MKRISVRSRYDLSLENSLKNLLLREAKVQDLKLRRVYWLLEKAPGFFKEIKIDELTPKVFFDPISEEMNQDFPKFNDKATYVEIRFLAGVTDNIARSATEALMLFAPQFKKSWQEFGVEVHSGWELEILGDATQNQIQKVLSQTISNSLLNSVSCKSGVQLNQKNSWAQFDGFWKASVQANRELQLFDLNFDVINKVNNERGLALSHDEINTIITQFSSDQNMQARTALGWAGKITEVELECIAQTWSEHCKHKIFAAEIEYTEQEGVFPKVGSKNIKSLYKSYIQKATRDLEDVGFLVSVFKDNGGIVDFDKNLNVCVKVETHNSPSALDPFGGAITGILGVNRDILGCGLGAKPIANMDVFCLSQKEMFPSANSPKRPELLKEPGVIFRGVHQGVEEGGNQSGIPTVNGSFYFASEFSAKPLVFVGSLGLMPKTVDQRPSHQKRIKAGDLIVVAGGRLGKDGVHGATFSSLALHDQVASNVVQIGDSITQKRLLDFTLIARDKGWIEAVTDNGAGGVSSSIGEMAQFSNGAKMDLSRHPVKYEGLEYWEMLVSESQERMSYAVDAKNVDKFLSLAQDMGVEASVLGEFTDSGYFDVLHQDKVLAKMSLEFLHDGLKPMKLKAHFNGPIEYKEFHRENAKPAMPAQDSKGLLQALETVMSSPNVASREPLVRYYDHEVQGATRLKPYSGKTQQGASDAGVIEMSVHGGEENSALAVSNGLCPQYSYYDTYLMAQKAVDEAIRNLVATGADPQKIALVDNFCWPDPVAKSSNLDGEHKMAQLVRACEGLYDAALTFRAPFVSGKDSMKNDFIGKNKAGETVKISVPPTVLVTAIAKVPDSSKVIPGYFKNAGDSIYAIGTLTQSLYGSALEQQYNVGKVDSPEYPNLKHNTFLYENVFKAISSRLLSSCHDISEGGLMGALSESCFGNSLGMDLNLSKLTWNQLWSEVGSVFVVSVPDYKLTEFEDLFGARAHKLGVVTTDANIKWTFKGQTGQVATSKIQTLWSKGVTDVYNS